MSESISLYPQPKRYQLLGGESALSPRLILRANGAEAQRLSVQLDVERRCRESIAGSALEEEAPASTQTTIEVEFDANLHPQGYVLEWNGDRLQIRASAEVGLHYALVTLEQLVKRQGLAWAHIRIEDEPDFLVRGVMLDIGRNKIPKMGTLYALIDRLAELKMNHLQLYMEGYCYEYEKYKPLFPDATPITAAELRELDVYARSRYIDFVPNQNCLGHMAHWLAKPEIRPLAEYPDGMPTPMGFTLHPTTLNPTDERAVQLAKDMFDDLLPNFTSEYANINLDEPFGLGTGQSKARADEIGIGMLYLEYAEKMVEIVRGHGKRTLMWGDILTKHPEAIPFLPKDVTVLDWNYESRVSFEEHGKLLQDAGVPFYVCPGTSSWSSISGRTDNMLHNIADAARNGKTYGADGLLVTDWGDKGHWQAMAVSYPGFAYAAGASWQVDANVDQIEQLESFLNDCVFHDRSGQVGNLLLELGRYYLMENSSLVNMTYTHMLIHSGVSTREKLEFESGILMKIQEAFGSPGGPFKLDYQFDAMMEWLEQRKAQFSQIDLAIPDCEIVKDELANTIRLIELGIGLHRVIHRIDISNGEEEAAWMDHLKAELKIAIAELERLWRERNREGGLSGSVKELSKLLMNQS